MTDLEYTVRPISDRSGFTGRPGSGDRYKLARSSWSSTQTMLARELRELAAHTVVLEVDVRERDITVAGQLRANATVANTSPAVRLAFETDDGPMQFATDVYGWDYYDRPRAQGWQENVRAIALGLESLRRVDRYGITRRGEQYRGFRAIEGGITTSGMSPDTALKVIADESASGLYSLQTAAQIATAVRRARAFAHPDRNGGDRSRSDAVDQAVQVLTRTGRLA